MPKVNYEFDIWDERFSTNKVNEGGIYKIYFNGFPEHQYVGKTTQSAGFKKRITEHKSSLWRIYSGISVRGDSLESRGLLKQNEYRKLSGNEKQKYDKKLERFRKQKISNFEKDLLTEGDSKYIKMIVFMEMNNLSLQDLRFEILMNENDLNGKDLFDVEHEIINENQCYEKGFNATAMAEYVFGGVGERKNINSLIKMKEIIMKKEADQYSQWNCWWNLYQTFKFSFLDNTLGWMNYWKKISIKELRKNLSELTLLLFEQNKVSRINKDNIFTLSVMEQLKNEESLNVLPILDFFVSNHQTVTINKLIKIEKWIQNDNDYFFNLYQTKNENDNDFYHFYGSWEEIYDLFKNNPFHNTLSIDTLTKWNFENFLNSYNVLITTSKAIKDYRNLLNNLYLEFNKLNSWTESTIGNIIYEYYFKRNCLNSLVFK